MTETPAEAPRVEALQYWSAPEAKDLKTTCHKEQDCFHRSDFLLHPYTQDNEKEHVTKKMHPIGMDKSRDKKRVETDVFWTEDVRASINTDASLLNSLFQLY